MHEHLNPREPYRLLFPLGLLLAAVGIAPWIFFYLGLIPTYPVIFHSHLMFHGFLMAFISGFLMTAVPRMSGTAPCQPFEAIVVALLLAAQMVVGGHNLASSTLFTVHSAFLLSFVLRRIAKRRQNPPTTFLFIPAGLFAALLGGLLSILGDQLAPPLAELAKLLVFQAFVINLVIGLGSRLIPVLSRAPGALSPMQSGGGGMGSHLPLLVIFNLSFLVEVFIEKRFGIGLRAVSLTWAVVAGLRLFAAMTPPTMLGVALRLSSVFLVVPYYLILAFPEAQVQWLHLSYIGGLGLMTLMVAVRVVLAHGGVGFEKEQWSAGLAGVAALVMATALIRSIGPAWRSEESFAAYALAGILWLSALATWWMAIGRKIDKSFAIFRKENS